MLEGEPEIEDDIVVEAPEDVGEDLGLEEWPNGEEGEHDDRERTHEGGLDDVDRIFALHEILLYDTLCIEVAHGEDSDFGARSGLRPQ